MPVVPRLVVIDRRDPDRSALAGAADVLRRGGLVAFPTETVYGLGASALDPDAIARVFAAKGRPRHHPLIVHVLGEPEARALASRWPAQASALARAYWPGPLTLVVERAPQAALGLAREAPSVAIRAPSHPIARALLEVAGVPIAAPSANRYQQLSPTTAAHVVAQLGAAVDLVLDGGPCEAGIESTVVDVRGEQVTVLRPGALGLAALRKVVGPVLAGPEVQQEMAPRASPGVGARHYAPRARLVLADNLRDAIDLASHLARGSVEAPHDPTRATHRVALVTHVPVDREAVEPFASVEVRTLPAEAAGYAHALYATLHALDADAVDTIVVVRVPPDESWWAIADRLARGAALEPP